MGSIRLQSCNNINTVQKFKCSVCNEIQANSVWFFSLWNLMISTANIYLCTSILQISYQNGQLLSASSIVGLLLLFYFSIFYLFIYFLAFCIFPANSSKGLRRILSEWLKTHWYWLPHCCLALWQNTRQEQLEEEFVFPEILRVPEWATAGLSVPTDGE